MGLQGIRLLHIRPPVNSAYGIHNPKGVASLTQLKVGLSKLNLHEFKHNFNPIVLGDFLLTLYWGRFSPPSFPPILQEI